MYLNGQHVMAMLQSNSQSAGTLYAQRILSNKMLSIASTSLPLPSMMRVVRLRRAAPSRDRPGSTSGRLRPSAAHRARRAASVASTIALTRVLLSLSRGRTIMEQAASVLWRLRARRATMGSGDGGESFVRCSDKIVGGRLPRRRHPTKAAQVCRIHSTRYPRNEYISTGLRHIFSP